MRTLPSKPTCYALTLVLLLLTSARLHAQSKGIPTGDDAPVVLRTPATKADRDRMRAHLTTAERALPVPSSKFRLAPEGEERIIGNDAGKLDDPDLWNPIQAWLSRTYETRTTGEEDERTVEINLALNGDRGLSPGLASVGGPIVATRPHDYSADDALFVHQTIIGADEGSRVALPLSTEEKERALTLVRVYVVPHLVEERIIREIAAKPEDLPRLVDADVTARRPDAVTTVVVELRGERRDVDALRARIDIPALRKFVGR